MYYFNEQNITMQYGILTLFDLNGYQHNGDDRLQMIAQVVTLTLFPLYQTFTLNLLHNEEIIISNI